jgi:hypothetical protein
MLLTFSCSAGFIRDDALFIDTLLANSSKLYAEWQMGARNFLGEKPAANLRGER